MKLISGNEAVAQAAFDAGCRLATGYPGTPSTETLETFAKFDDVYAEWCTNEKVALEVALGASCAGRRVLVTMKHVGVNVAADPLFTAAYTGVVGGLVILAADDPGMHSSQNEQDSRYYGLAAHIPVLEPSSSQDAYDMTRKAFVLSEKFDIPVIVRSTVRISHTKCIVTRSECDNYSQPAYESNPSKWVMMPAFARGRRKNQLELIENLKSWASTDELNSALLHKRNIGVVCSGATYQHVREALPDASVLKMGITWPVSSDVVKRFSAEVDKVYVVEEASTYLHERVSESGVEICEPPHELPKFGELDPQLIKEAFGVTDESLPECFNLEESLPARPPSLCPGCPHRVVFKELSRLKAIVTGDIGCYTLGALPPLGSMDTCVCMGASVSMSHGLQLGLLESEKRPVVAIIGDSTFAHSGIESLASTAYNLGGGTICVLDNRTTAMTGRQGNPFNGTVAQGGIGRELDLKKVAYALGVDSAETIDPYDVGAVRDALKRATASKDTLDVLIFKHPCVLLDKYNEPSYHISGCISCGVCLTLGCPAIGKDLSSGMAYIDESMCVGCGQCCQYCHTGAIVREG